jgi:hypothetical protein
MGEAFTPEPGRFEAVGKSIFGIVSSVLEMAQQQAYQQAHQVATLKLLLTQRGVFTPEEFDAALAEVRAAHAIEVALAPDVTAEMAAMEEEWNRLVREAREQAEQEEGA